MAQAKKVVLAGNWKLNKSPREALEFLKAFTAGAEKFGTPDNEPEVIFFPSAFSLWIVQEFLRETKFNFGAQNCYFEGSGAFTGENSPQVPWEMGGTYSLIGHSERRQLFHETENEISKKVSAFQNIGLTPMLCVGETLEERESGQTFEVLKSQLQSAVTRTTFNKPIYIAYEPVWAIGTGKVATPQQAQDAHAFLRTELKSLTSRADEIPLLYGGSVKPQNALELLQQNDIDGFLVGGASLEVDQFLKLYEIGLSKHQ